MNYEAHGVLHLDHVGHLRGHVAQSMLVRSRLFSTPALHFVLFVPSQNFSRGFQTAILLLRVAQRLPDMTAVANDNRNHRRRQHSSRKTPAHYNPLSSEESSSEGEGHQHGHRHTIFPSHSHQGHDNRAVNERIIATLSGKGEHCF